jgi:hypothetical protein
MQAGIIRRRGDPQILGRWRADLRSIVIETADPKLRAIADEILKRPLTIPVHGAERFEFAGQAEPLIETPSQIRFLALFALEMEERGFEMQSDEEETL